MKAVAMVAHPDDCVIFAYSYIYNHPEHDWTICYLTYGESDSRAQEFKKFWNDRNIATAFLGYQDDYRDIERKQISFDQAQALKEIGNLVATYDLVLTHNERGEYGHLHHVFVNHATAGHPHRVTFADPGSGTAKYSVPTGAYNLDELPMHRAVIAGFHGTTHTNEYSV
jgi:LmbE family N-acetylglucosaminyl deacetylase